MAGNRLRAKRRKLPFDDVQVGAAHAAGAHAQQDVAGSQRGARDVSDGQRPLGNFLRRCENGGFHANHVRGNVRSKHENSSYGKGGKGEAGPAAISVCNGERKR